MKLTAFVSLFIFMLSHFAGATESTSAIRGQLFYNSEFRYDRGESQEWELRHPMSLALGARYETYSLVLDYSRWSVTSGNASLNTDLVTEESVLWLQKDFWAVDWVPEAESAFYLGAGAGAMQREIRTTLLGSSTSDKSKLYGILGVSAGLQSRWFVIQSMPRLGFALGLEARVHFSQEYDPNPQPSMLVRLGVLF